MRKIEHLSTSYCIICLCFDAWVLGESCPEVNFTFQICKMSRRSRPSRRRSKAISTNSVEEDQRELQPLFRRSQSRFRFRIVCCMFGSKSSIEAVPTRSLVQSTNGQQEDPCTGWLEGLSLIGYNYRWSQKFQKISRRCRAQGDPPLLSVNAQWTNHKNVVQPTKAVRGRSGFESFCCLLLVESEEKGRGNVK